MTASEQKYFFNSNYFIELLENIVINFYKIDNLNQIISNKNYDFAISNIEFNPVKENIIVISFYNGYCKICNISDKGIEEKIVFEGIDNQKIKKSIFNVFNTNIIASLNLINKILIWDVRKQRFWNIINFKDNIINIKWNKKYEDILEVRTLNEIKLFDVKKNTIISTFKYSDKIVDYSVLSKEIIILIKFNKLEKLTNEKENKSLYIKEISGSNENLIRNNILIILSFGKLNFIHVINLTNIYIYECHFSNFYNFIESNDKNGLLFYYYKDIVNKNLITFRNVKMKTISENSDLNNFENNFYQQYEKQIFKYICLLNFEENIEKEKPMYKKKYMKIKEIETFFDKIKKINIFDRKDLIEKILENKFINKEISEIFKNDNFEQVKICFSLTNIAIENQQKEIISKMNELYKSNKDFIKEMYFQLIKLLTMDNTNDKLLEIYLFFLNKYETILIKDESLGKYIEKYESEVNYYYPCFSKERYKILFNIKKEGEKEIVLDFLQKAYVQVLVDEAQKILLNLPDFNQPIEYDCKNIELRWHKIKTHLVETFKEFKFKENDIKMEENKNFEKEKDKIQKALGRLKNGINIVMKKGLLKNDSILNNKYKLDCAISLIINPCTTFYKEADFYSNLLICEPLDENKLYELEKKDSLLKIDKDNNTLKISYNNYIFKDPEYLCVDNLLNKNFLNDKKYNFDYLVKNCVRNQDKIKSFLKNILAKKVFLDINEILFGNKEYKYLNKNYIDELIDNRIKFVPIGPYDSLALSDKISISTMISIKDKLIKDSNLYDAIEYKIKSEILNTASYISIELNEIFHLFNCIPYYENNCSLSIKTPRKKYLEDCEGGHYLEYLLFDMVLNELNLAQALYILNESNYDKSLIEFKIGFNNLDIKDLKIKGVFMEYKNLIDLEKTDKSILKNISIVQKISSLNSIPSVKIRLQKDVIGNLERPNKNLISQ